MRAALLWLCALALAIAVSYDRGYVHGRARAKAALDVLQSSYNDDETILKAIRAQLDQQRAELDHLRHIGTEALSQRDALAERLKREATQRRIQLTELAHEHADCADLDRPLCPAVAERLFNPTRRDAP